MNLCLFNGRVVKTPKIETVNGYARTSLSLAVRRKYKNKSGDYETDFIHMIAWRKTAEYLTKYIKQGDLIETNCIYRTIPYEKNGQNLTYRYFECKDISFIAHPYVKANSQDIYEDIPDEPIPNEISFQFFDHTDELEME